MFILDYIAIFEDSLAQKLLLPYNLRVVEYFSHEYTISEQRIFQGQYLALWAEE